MSLYGAPAVLTGTNPFSFALPAEPTPRLIDQASSAAAWVKIREAAGAGEPIPEGWALEPDGAATTDAAAAALLGPLLPFGGVKGSNIALVVELLSVLSGASFSMDAPDFASGTQPPRVGLFLLALAPAAFAPDYLQRVDGHFTRLRERYGIDFGRYLLKSSGCGWSNTTMTAFWQAPATLRRPKEIRMSENWTPPTIDARATPAAILKTDQPKTAESNIAVTSRHEFGCVAVLPYNLGDGVTRVSGRRIGEAAWWTRQHHDGAGTQRLAREHPGWARRRRVGRARPRRRCG
jgi:Malate/L-lactate dehydrogenase